MKEDLKIIDQIIQVGYEIMDLDPCSNTYEFDLKKLEDKKIKLESQLSNFISY